MTSDLFTQTERETKEGRESVGKTERPHKRSAMKAISEMFPCVLFFLDSSYDVVLHLLYFSFSLVVEERGAWFAPGHTGRGGSTWGRPHNGGHGLCGHGVVSRPRDRLSPTPHPPVTLWKTGSGTRSRCGNPL